VNRHHTVHRTLSAATGSLILVAGVTGIAVAASDQPTLGSDQPSSTVEDAGVDSGPDADATEPGHQDANESGEVEAADGAEEADGAEVADGAEAADGADEADGADGADEADGADGADTDVNSGPDANPNEPGHQDADESGEVQD